MLIEIIMHKVWTASPFFGLRLVTFSLTLQHELITQILSRSLLLLPEAAISNLSSEDAKVLDVGTGNAVWLSHLYSTSRLPRISGVPTSKTECIPPGSRHR